jgi:proteic killer suppression protein
MPYYLQLMIKSFDCKETRKIWEGQLSRKFPLTIQNRALNKLRLIDAANNINDLRRPPGNRFEMMTGDRKSLHSIRINDQWLICFNWINNDAYFVLIEDNH